MKYIYKCCKISEYCYWHEYFAPAKTTYLNIRSPKQRFLYSIDDKLYAAIPDVSWELFKNEIREKEANIEAQ